MMNEHEMIFIVGLVTAVVEAGARVASIEQKIEGFIDIRVSAKSKTQHHTTYRYVRTLMLREADGSNNPRALGEKEGLSLVEALRRRIGPLESL